MCVVCLGGDSASLVEPDGSAGTVVSHGLTETQIEAGRLLLTKAASIDIHAHPGRFFMNGGAKQNPFEARYAPPFPDRAIAEMKEGGVSAVLFATVADHVLLGIGAGGLGAQREFEPGEAIADHQRQINALQSLVRNPSLMRGFDADDILSAHTAKRVACIFSVEGGDFVEDRLERIAQAHDSGVRAITIIHYHVNQIGDTQTENAVHGGLTPLGRDIVREMQRVGIIVDLAHASFDATAASADVATRPMMISHSNVATRADSHPRLISPDHARLVTQGGGLIGAVPAGFGQAHFSDYIDTIIAMTDMLGVDHVAIGTDMDFTYRPVMTSYRDWPLVPAALLARGMHEGEVIKIMGGNFLRILAAA